jgi:hypothetical protein
LWSFGIFFLFWYVWNKKYLATLQSSWALLRKRASEKFSPHMTAKTN